MIHPENSPDESLRADHGAQVNSQRVDLGGMTLVAIMVFALIVGACGVVIGLDTAERGSQRRDYDARILDLRTVIENDQRAWRMAELKYDELNLVVRRAGLVLPGDYGEGVGGNLDSGAFAKPKVKHGRHSLHHPAQRDPQVQGSPDGPR